MTVTMPLLHNSFSQSQMEALIKVAEAVNSTLNLKELFQLTLEESIKAIQDADGGVLFLYDKELAKLVCPSFVNFTPTVTKISLDPNESITGNCFSSRKPILITSPEELAAETESMSASNRRLFDASLAVHSGQNAFRVMCVPLITENDDCIGAITLNGFAEEGTFSEEDLRLLQAIAGQAAIALSKAQLHFDLQEKNEQFEQIITYQQQLLLKMNAGAGLASMLEQLSKQIQKPVSLLTIYGEHIQLGDLKDHFVTNEFPIQSGRLLLGKLFVSTEPGHEISDTDCYFIQQSILFFTLEINRESALREVEHRFKSELMDDLLNGILKEDFLIRAKGLGLDIDNLLLPVTAITEATSTEESITDFSWKREIANLLQVEVNQHFPGSLVVQKQQRYIVLLSVRDDISKPFLLKKIKRLADDLQRLINQQVQNLTIKLGIGKCVHHIEELPDSIEDSIKVLQFLHDSDSRENVIDSASLGFERLLIPNKDKDIDAFVMSTLGAIIRYDQEKDSKLLKTLRTYTQFLQRPGQAAKELHIHLNTLHYRLKKISELLHVDLQDSNDLLNLQLACKLLPEDIEK
ncbi:helix-turn-helix domain-containing protein [Planococcus salinus]|nr:helix-turn-helix domain-containing protein [Planococcus salinus]